MYVECMHCPNWSLATTPIRWKSDITVANTCYCLPFGERVGLSEIALPLPGNPKGFRWRSIGHPRSTKARSVTATERMSGC
jgi:hypothetical protein